MTLRAVAQNGGVAPNQTITTPNIIGVSDGSNAPAGSVGEVVTSSVAFGSAIALTSSVTANVTSISLTAGDWDVTGFVGNNPAALTMQTYLAGCISLTSATTSTNSFNHPYGAAAGVAAKGSVPLTRINVSATTTVYLTINSIFTMGTNGGYGTIYARRVR